MKRFGQIIISLILSVCIAMSNIVLVSAAGVSQVKSLKAKTVTYNSVTLSWKKVKGVTGYEIQQYKNKKWKTIKKAYKKVTYTVKKLKTGTKYKFRVRAYKKGKSKNTYGKYSKTLSVTPVPSKVKAKISSVTVNSAKLSWSKVSGASGYYVQKKSGKKWKTVATVKSKSKSYTVKKLSLGKTYSYRVVAYRTVGKKKVKGKASSTLKVKPAVPQTKNLKVTEEKTDSVVLSWNKVSGATGYQIQKKENGTWKTFSTVNVTTSEVLLVPGEEYEIRVVAFAKSGSKTYTGSASNIVKVELEKISDEPSTDEAPDVTEPTTKPSTGKEPEGEEPTTKPSGTQPTTKPSGSDSTTKPSGTQPTTKPSGSDSTTKPSGSDSTTKPSGSDSTTKPSGTESTTKPSVTEPSTTKPTTTQPTTTQSSSSKPTVKAAKSVKATASPSEMVVTWTAASGATGYEVEMRAGSGSWNVVATVSDTTATVSTEPGIEYDFRVHAFAVADGQTYYGSYSTVLNNAIYKINSASSLTVVSYSKEGVSLKWNAASGATGYEVRKQDGSNWVTVLTTDTNTAVVPIEPGVKYGFRVTSFVTAHSKNYYGKDTATKSVTYTIPPTSNLNIVSTGKESASLTWKAATSSIDGYEIQKKDGNNWVKVATATEAKATVPIVPGVNYEFRVLAFVNMNGRVYYGSPTAEKETKYAFYNATTLKAGTATKDGVSLSWNAAKGVDGYEIQRQNGSAWVKLIESTTNSAFAPMVPNTGYTLRVVAYIDANGVRYYSNPTGTVSSKYTIASASGLTAASVNKDSAALTWNSAADAKAYELQYYNGSSWVTYETVSGTSANVSIVPAQTYKYRVITVVDSNGTDYKGGSSNELTVKYTVASATELKASEVTSSSATLVWNASRDASYYEVQILNGSTWTTVETVTEPTYSISIVPDVTYKYRVISAVTVNGKDYKAAASNEVDVKYTVPVPVYLRVTAADDTTVTLTWNAAEGVESYVVYNGSEEAVTVTDTTATVTGLTKATAYTFTVKATQTIDGKVYFSPASNAVTGKTSPDKVTGLVCVKPGQSSVELKWDKEAVADGYTVYKKAPAGEWESAGNTSSTSFVATGLLTETEYEFRVAAYHKVNGTSVYGAESDSVKVLTAFNTVEGLMIEEMKTNIVKIDWAKVDGAYYESYYKKSASAEFKQVNYGASTTDYCYLVINDETDIGFKVTDTTNCMVKVSWNAVDGASKYYVQSRSSGSLGGWTTVATSTGTSASFMVAPKTAYELRLIACDGSFKVRAYKENTDVNATDPYRYTAYEQLDNIPGTISEKIEVYVENPVFNANDKTVKTAYVLKAVQAINNTKAETTLTNVKKTEIVETKIDSLKVSHPAFFFGAWVDVSEFPGVDVDELMGITQELNVNKSYTGSVTDGVYSYTLADGTTGRSTFSKSVSPYAGDAYLYNAADINSIDSKITGITYSASGTQETIELTLAREVATKSNDVTPVHKGLYEDFSGTAGAPGMDDGRVTVGPTKIRLVINENGTLDYMKVTTSFEMYSQMTEEGISFRMTVDGTKVEDTYTFTR